MPVHDPNTIAVVLTVAPHIVAAVLAAIVAALAALCVALTPRGN